MIHLIISEPCIMLNRTINEIVKDVLVEKDEFNYGTFDFEVNSLEEIIDFCNSASFTSEKKVAICKNPYFFVDSKIKLPFVNDFSILEDYIYNQNDNCEVIIIANKKLMNEKNKHYYLIKSTGKVTNLLIETKEELIKHARYLVKMTKMEIDDDAFDLFLNKVNDITNLEKEIAKLVLYGQKIDVDVIEKLISTSLEDDVFSLSNALLKKDVNKAMKIYNDLKLLKHEPVSLIALLAKQFHFLLQVFILKGKNKKEDYIANYLKVHPYRVKLAVGQLKIFSLEQIKKYLTQLSDLELDIKNGTKDRFIEFELFLASCH